MIKLISYWLRYDCNTSKEWFVLFQCLSCWCLLPFEFTQMTSSNGNIFRVTGPLCGEFTGPVNSPHKGQWRGALMFSLIFAWINDWVNNREASDLRCHRSHYDVNVMFGLTSSHLFGSNLLHGLSIYIVMCTHLWYRYIHLLEEPP